MREFKFRAWSNKINDFVGKFTGWDEYGPSFIAGNLYSDDCIIEQFTGEYDNSNIEIYEGDIVEANNVCTFVQSKITGHFSVDFSDGFFWLTNINDACDMWAFNDVPVSMCKVIGNIHENA